MKQILLLVLSVFTLVACNNPNTDTTRQAQYCQQANSFMDEVENNGPLSPRDWGNLMHAGARLVYATNICGDRIMESKEDLCATLNDMLQVYVNNPMVPLGKNRDMAINQSSGVYQRARCEPPLDIS